MTPTQVLLDDVRCEFGERVALDLPVLAVQGGLVSVLGPNGAGKTTLLRTLATVAVPRSGQVLIDGLDPSHEADRIECRRRLAYLPQQPGFHPKSTVFDAVDYIAVLRGHRDERARRFAVAEAIDEVGLRDRLAERVDDLSGGMRRRLGLAQTLIGGPTLLLLDEPAAGLDPDERRRLREIVTRRRHRATILASTHQVDEAAVSDRVLVICDGRLTFDGAPETLRRHATGRSWIQDTAPTVARASWTLPDGRWRCLGDPPQGAQLVEPTLEDGYLLALDAPT